MSCEACVPIPLDAHARFMRRVRKRRTIHTSKARIVYVSPKSDRKLLVDGSLPSIAIETYFSVDSGDHTLTLQDRRGNVLTEDTFVFDPNKRYTLIVRGEDIFQLADYWVCSEPGSVHFQVSNMGENTLNIYLDEELVFENVKPLDFVETSIDADIYDVRVEPEIYPSIEVELKSPNMYTVFFASSPPSIFVVENDNCVNLV